MDFFKNAANSVRGFFTSVFNQDDEEEKRRRRQQQAKQQAPKQAQQFRNNVTGGTLTTPTNQAQQKQQPKEIQNTLSEQFRKLQVQTPAPKPQVRMPSPIDPMAAQREKSRQQSELITTGKVTPRIQGVTLSAEEFRQAAERRAQLNRKATPALDTAREITTAPLKVAGTVANWATEGIREGAVALQDMGRAQFSLDNKANSTFASDKWLEKESRNIDASLSQGRISQAKATQLKAEAQKRNQEAKQSHERAKVEYKQKFGKDLPDPNEEIVKVAIGALDVATLGIVPAARVALKGADGLRAIMSKPVKDAASDVKKVVDEVLNQARSAAESRTGRKLTDEEEARLLKQTEEAVDTELNQVRKEVSKESPSINKPTEAKPNGANPNGTPTKQTESPPQPKTREEVETSYKNIVNTINNDSNLNPAQKAEYLESAKTQHADMLRKLDEGSKAGDEVVDEAAQANRAQQDEMAETVEQVQTQQRAAATPEPEELGQGAPVKDPDDPLDAEVDANNAYDEDISEALAARRQNIDDIRDAQNTPVLRKGWNWLRQNFYDPLAVTESEAGTDVASLMMRMANSDAAVRANLEDSGIRQLIKKYGDNPDDIQNFFNPGRRQLSRDFEDYRIFKDELWRMNDEGREVSSVLDSNGNPLDPRVMAAHIRQMDEARPDFAEDAAKLREFSLENMRRRTEVGADSREMYENSARNPFYTPREQASPDDKVAPQISGIHNRVATSTKGRGDAAYNVTSPMRMFVDDTRNTVKGEASQERAGLLLDQGLNVAEDAGAAAIRRDSMREMTKLADERRSLRDSLKDARGNRKVVRAELKGLEDRAVERMRNYFIEQSADPAAKKAARSMSREELLDIFNLATESGEVPGKTIAKGIGTRQMTEADLDRVVQSIKADIKGTREKSTDAYEAMMDNIEFNPKTGMATISYKEDGATGKIEIPAEWAREWSKADAQFNRSPLGKALDALGNVFKVTWTGTLAPVFQLAQVIMNTGLMFRNADGLTGVNLRAWQGFVQGLLRNNKIGGNDDMRRAVEQYGAQFETATQGVILRRNITDDIVNHAGIKEFLLRNPARTFGDIANSLNRALAHVSNAQRMAVVNGAYHKALKHGTDEETALKYAAQASAKTFGDFNRVSQLARNLEVLIPYSGAMQSGARAMVHATKARPIETTTKDAMILGSLAGIIGWNYQMGAKDYYDAMREQGADYEIDNNFVIAYGEVTQNEDGSWNNIVKIPLTPDFRPANRAVLESMSALEEGEGIDPIMLGAELFNYFTGDASSSLYDPERSSAIDGDPLVDSVLPQSPIVNLMRVVGNRDTWNGGTKVDELTSQEPKADQVYEGSTSDAAINLSNLLGNTISPIQADQVLSMFGTAGQSIRDTDEDKGLLTAMRDRMFDAKKRFTPKSAEVDQAKIDTRQHFESVEEVLHEAAAEGYDDATRAAFKALYAKKDDRSKENMLNSAVKAAQYMEYSGDGSFSSSQLFDLEKRLDAKKREQGKAGNPLFDLAPQELQAVLMYRSMKAPNAAKQNFSKDGEAAFTALGLDNPWYQQFRDAESEYYKTIFKDEDDDGTYKTFSGESKPQLTDEQVALQNQYFDLDKAGRKAFLANNQWLKDYWAESNGFTDQERKALGFSSLDGDDVYDGNSGSSYGKGGRGGRGGGEDRPNTQNVLNDIMNEAGTLKRLESLVGKEQAPQLMAELKRLFAPRRGGRANVPIGGRSNGQN